MLRSERGKRQISFTPDFASSAMFRGNGGKRQVKKHAIIPIFIPHLGCPNDCIFCNQKKITAKLKPVTGSDVEKTIETWLSTLETMDLDTIEVAFFGGSFTGLPIEDQSAYLAIAKRYKDSGRIDKIHMSTRPDYIDRVILDNLKRYDVDTIELGVQSFDDRVLKLSNRGHDSSIVYESSRLIKEYGFELGIQLMIGLPGDSLETCLMSAKETVKIAPSIARLYPTIVIDDTELCEQYKRGEYKPLPQDEAVFRTAEMYKILDDAGINIIRVGLKSSDIIHDGGEINGGTFHPAFRQLVEGSIARERLQEKLARMGFVGKSGSAEKTGVRRTKIDFCSCPDDFSNMIGNSSVNKKFVAREYPQLNIMYKTDSNLAKGEYIIINKENSMKNNEKAVVTVIGKDTVGILAKVATSCSEANCNVIEVTQSVLEDYFCMVMLISIGEATMNVDELQKKIQAVIPEMAVHVMHENIFSSMHRI